MVRIQLLYVISNKIGLEHEVGKETTGNPEFKIIFIE